MLGVGILWVSVGKKTEDREIVVKPETIIESVDPFLPIELKRPQEISWDNFGMEMITETEKMSVGAIEWSETEIGRAVTALGENLGTLNQKENWTTFGSEARGGFIDRLNNLIEWQKRIDSKDSIPKGKMPSQDEAREKITNLVEKISGEKIILAWGQTKYVKILYPQWVECPLGEADMMEVEADMTMGGKKITNFYGKMVTAVVGKGGEMIKLSLSLPPKITSKSEMVSLKTGEEIKSGRISNFRIKKTNAGRETETDNLRVNAVSGELVYIYSARGNWLKPYLVIEGNTFVNSTPLRISMLYSAAK